MALPLLVNSGFNPVKTVLTIGGLVLGGYGVWQLKKYADRVKDANNLKKEQDSTIKAAQGKKLFDLNGKPIQSANLGMIAADLHDSLKFPTDDPRVVRVFKTTPFGYVTKLEQFYLDRYGKNLKQELVENLNDKSWIQIKYNFR